MITLGLKLFLAHVLGDFVFQPDKWVKGKTEKKHKSKYLYFHVAVHALILLLLLKFDFFLLESVFNNRCKSPNH